MPLILPGNVASALPTGFNVANSCRFNPGDSPEFSRSTGDGNEDVGSFSFWWKTAKVPGGATFYSIYVDSSNFFTISVDGGGNFQVLNKLSGSYNMQFESTATFRDPSAWYNFVVLVDTTQAVEANRMKAYVNGTQITSWQTATYPSQNTDMIMNSNSRTAYISHSGDRMHAYLAEFVLIDGTAQAVTDFGEFDEDSPTIWKPKDVSGLTKGVNGFYLDFEDSSALGNCAFGGTDFTVSNLDATDQATDTPTNNFCTANPLDQNGSYTLSQGNCQLSSGHTSWYNIGSTMAVTKGKWFWEVELDAGTMIEIMVGFHDTSTDIKDINAWLSGSMVFYNDAGGEFRIDGVQTTADYGVLTAGDILGFALNMDDKELTLYDNGSAIATDVSIGSNINEATPSFISDATNVVFKANFGGCSAFTVSSANQDGNGYGNFEYAVPSGYYALCTKNLAEYG